MTADDKALLDELSEMLAVERDRERLYEEFLRDAPADLQAKALEYAEQSRRGALVLEEAVRRLGGDPAHVSPGAEVVHRMTEAMMAATESAATKRWMYRALHLVSYETRDRMVWRALDALADERGGETGEVLKTAATAVLSEEALGAHGVDRSEERIGLILEAMETELAHELGVPADRTGRRRGIRRLR
jgi:hypothetical protein